MWFPSRRIEKKRPMFILLFLIWVECIILTSFPYFGWYGTFGFDPIHGKCHFIECEKDRKNRNIKPSVLVNTIGVGIPFVIVILSYSAVFFKLGESDNDDTIQYKRSTIILTICYFFFIFPIYVVEFIPVTCYKVRNLELWRNKPTYVKFWLFYRIWRLPWFTLGTGWCTPSTCSSTSSTSPGVARPSSRCWLTSSPRWLISYISGRGPGLTPRLTGASRWGGSRGRCVCSQRMGQHQPHSESMAVSEKIPRSPNVKNQISLSTKTLVVTKSQSTQTQWPLDIRFSTSQLSLYLTSPPSFQEITFRGYTIK